MKNIEEIYNCVKDFENKEGVIIEKINEILVNTVEFFK